MRSHSGQYLYLTDVKINLLIVTKNSTVNNYVPSVYSSVSTDGSNSVYTKTFEHNFGINASLYGSESSGYCLHGLRNIDLYHFDSSSVVVDTYFLFTYNGTEVSDIVGYTIYGIKLQTSCYGYCPSGYILSSSGCSCP